MIQSSLNDVLRASLLASTTLIAPHALQAQPGAASPTPPGLYITPTALAGAVQQNLNPNLPLYPNFVAGEAVKAVVSPDGATLAILTAGQNSLNNSSGSTDTANSTQYIFLYDVSGANKTSPALRQVIKQTNSHVGLVWSPDGATLYAAGGNDDAVYVYAKTAGSFVAGAPIPLGHGALHANNGIGFGVQSAASGLAVSADGKTLVAANNYNDSISVIDTASKTVRYEYDLRPYNTSGTPGVAGGSFPYSVVLKGNVAYVGSDRDREIVVVDVSSPTAAAFVTRIKLDGNANGMTLGADGTLYVAQDNADQVAVISTASNTITARIDTRGPASLSLPAKTTGAAPTAVTINPANNTLYAVNAGSNSIAVIPLSGPGALAVAGLLPTAYDPTDVAFSADGAEMYIVNGKSDQGPNPGYTFGNTALLGVNPAGVIVYPEGAAAHAANGRSHNQYQFQLEHASLVSAQVPTASALAAYTSQVALNNGYATPAATLAGDAAVMSFLASKISHVIYIVKENRTFDQILGDLSNGSNGDPSLTLFGRRITPNFHRLASQFVTLDNFMDPGDGSMDGWSWSMRGRVTNTETITQQENYASVNRGLSYEGEGENRNIPSNLPTPALRDKFYDPTGLTTPFTTNAAAVKGGAANLLAGDGDHAATDGPDGYQEGYIFNVLLNKGLTVRNYGWMANTPGAITHADGTPVKDPFADGIIQTTTGNDVLFTNNYYDPYFRAYDQAYPDVWRFNEWNREFQGFVRNGNLPNLSMFRGLSHDHTGSFGSALAGVNTPELQQADNDAAIGLLVDAVAHSVYASNTLIIVIEDDCQDGADHVDSHRSTTYFVGPYVKKNTVVSTRYSQTNVLRTIEDIFGAKHVNLNTAFARPMADVFDITSGGAWTYTATASTILRSTTLALADLGVQYAEGPDVFPTHDAAYWADATKGFDFSGEDRVPADLYNEILWNGLRGDKPYPGSRNGVKFGMADVPTKN